MALATGTRLGPYEVVAAIGAGGMGEVYRALDSRLNREVAIKVLPAHLSNDVEFRQRFEREARAISQLSHPNICVLHDRGSQDGIDYLVFEYLEGETLGTRLHRGPLPPDQVLKYGAQIADALDKAHRRGVVHRDLKPDNIMLTKSGVKVLDFGLAKPFINPGSMTSLSAATLANNPLTSEGTLLGTFQYMSPEQLEGKDADVRSDIFALGSVLYEMATGKRAFEGKSGASVVAAIMNTDPPPLSSVAPLTPPALEWATRKCLSKDPEERWQSAGDLASELRWIQEGVSRAGAIVAPAVKSRRRMLRWILLAAALVVGGLLGYLMRRPPEQPTWRVAINVPAGTNLVPDNAIALSPDGRKLLMTLADATGRNKFWVRDLSSEAAIPLDGTEGGITPFWSPDGKYIRYFALDGKVRKIPAAGGQAEAICDLWQVYGGTWGSDNVIVFATGARGLFKVSADGGTPVRIPVREGADYRAPSFLPDGKHLLAVSNAKGGIFVISAETGEVQPVVDGIRAQYAEPGYLLFLKGTDLMAELFDPSTLRVSGNARRVAESVYRGDLSFSAKGNLLVYQRAFKTQLTWFDWDGKRQSTVGEPDYVNSPYISPDGKYVLATVTDPRSGSIKLWLYDLTQGTAAPFTFGNGIDQYPAWSPDSKQVAFSSNRGGQEDIYVKAVASGSQEQLLLNIPGDKEPDKWSPDGRYLLFDYVTGKETGTDVYVMPLFGDRKPFPVAHSSGNENWGTFSPDGKWVAYSSDETGRAEIYAVSFLGPEGKWQISTKGGITSFWLPGNRLAYMWADGVTETEVTAQGDRLIVGKSRQILTGAAYGTSTGLYPDWQRKRWLIAQQVAEPNASPLILTTNWLSTLTH